MFLVQYRDMFLIFASLAQVPGAWAVPRADHHVALHTITAGIMRAPAKALACRQLRLFVAFDGGFLRIGVARRALDVCRIPFAPRDARIHVSLSVCGVWRSPGEHGASSSD